MARPKQQLIIEVLNPINSKWEHFGECNTEKEATDLLKAKGEETEFRLLLVKKTGKLEAVTRFDVIFDEPKD